MLEIDKIDQYKLGYGFTTNPAGENINYSDVSIFFNPKDLFKEGMSEDNFVAEYEKLIAMNLFNMEGDLTDISQIPEEELSLLEKIAKKYFDSIDKDNNGVLSKNEIEDLSLRDADNTNISDEDLQSLTDEIFSDLDLGLGAGDENPDIDDTPITEGDTPPSSGDSHNSGSNNYGNNYDTKSNTTSTQKAATLEELQEQKKKKETDLSSSRKNLKTIYSQGDENVNKAKAKYDEAVQNDEKISKELKERQSKNSADITAKEQEIGSFKAELVDIKASISSYNSTISAKESEIAALKASLENLDPNKEDTSKLKSEIQAKITQAETEKEEAQNKLNEATQKEKDLESKISASEKELATLNDEKKAIDSEISNNCSEDTKTALSEYNLAKEEADKAIGEAEKNVESLETEIKELDKQINEKQANKIQNEYRQTKLNKTYTLDGKEYLSLLSQEELDKFLKDEWNRGNYNHDSNCLAMSNQYCADLMKMLGIKGSVTDLMNDDESVIEQHARESLDKGYPVTLHVSTKAGTRHFATAVGYRITDDGKTVFLLADNVRGVGITGCGEGEYRHLITGYSTPYKDQNYGYRCMYYG